MKGTDIANPRSQFFAIGWEFLANFAGAKAPHSGAVIQIRAGLEPDNGRILRRVLVLAEIVRCLECDVEISFLIEGERHVSTGEAGMLRGHSVNNDVGFFLRQQRTVAVEVEAIHTRGRSAVESTFIEPNASTASHGTE